MEKEKQAEGEVHSMARILKHFVPGIPDSGRIFD
jgi:hypothetical protein